MEDPAPASDTAASPHNTVSQNSAITAGAPFYRQPAAIIALISLLLFGSQWYYSSREIAALQLELARRLSETEAQNKESRAVAERVRDATREIQVKLGVLESKLQESQNQQIALEALYQELSRGRDETLLADVEQTLLAANQQLQLAGNVKSALIALQAADARLARLERPQLVGLRKVIARDIERLKLAPYVDVIGISARLDNLIETIDSMPLALELRPAIAAVSDTKTGVDSNPWRRFARELWRDVRDLIRIQNIDRPDMPLLTPAQAYFLREHLKLRLLGARLALLGHNDKSFKADLKAASEWVMRYYDVNDRAAANTVATLRQLHDTQISIELPDLAGSLETVRNYRLTRERR